jgi:CubicO group peptidase (beta-lactamase class C family)
MKRVLAATAVAIALCALWSTLVVTWALRGVQTPIATRGDAKAFMAAAVERVKDAGIGNCALALIEDGRIFDSYFYSVGDPINDGTLFQMASVSKWVTSWGVLALVQQGRLELDAPVSRYLTRWRLPPSEFDNDGVTVRRLLSHTAGLTDRLGYFGFPPGTPAQSLEDSLTYATDHTPIADGHARVGYAPGSRWLYSGGGFTLLQLLIEEVTHDRFAHFMQQTVLDPLGMTRSTFDEDAAMARGVATSYSEALVPATHYHFSSPAAAALYSDLTDLARFALAHLPDEDGAAPGRSVLSPQTVAAMRAPAAQLFGRDSWGLGTMLFAKSGADHVFGHDGNNFPAINHAIRIDPVTRSGIIILSSGSDEFPARFAADWVYWKTGNVDFFGFLSDLPHLLGTIGIGAAVIVVLVATWVIRDTRSRWRRIALVGIGGTARDGCRPGG